MTSVTYFLGLLLALVIAVLGELVSDEVRARLDRLPLALLSAAARRLSPENWDTLYERAWLPELQHILRGDQATPITRLIHGMRYAIRLWLAAPQIMRELEPNRAPTTLSERIRQFVFAPDYVVVYRMTGLPMASGATMLAIRQPSWIDGLVASIFVVLACVFALFGRKRLIQAAGGHMPGQEVFCRCWLGTTCRSFAIPTKVMGTAVATILAFWLVPSHASAADILLVAICLFGPLWVQTRGFLLSPDADFENAKVAVQPGRALLAALKRARR